MTKETSTSKLRRYNIIAGVFHLVQMIAVLSLANDFSLPIVARYMSGPPGSTFAEPITLFDTPVGIGVATFLGLSAFFHFSCSQPNRIIDAFTPKIAISATTSETPQIWAMMTSMTDELIEYSTQRK